MNEQLQFIYNRRSVRKYTGEPIPAALLRDLLSAAMSAPSAVCKDPWHFIVVQNRVKQHAIAEVLPNGKMLGDAAAGIVVCGDLDKAHGNELSYMLQDCSAAIENILLAANVLGLGACWLGVHPREDRVLHVKRLYDLPENIIPVSAIALGWPEQKPEPRTRYDEKKVQWDCNG
jgi:nitroreductase